MELNQDAVNPMADMAFLVLDILAHASGRRETGQVSQTLPNKMQMHLLVAGMQLTISGAIKNGFAVALKTTSQFDLVIRVLAQLGKIASLVGLLVWFCWWFCGCNGQSLTTHSSVRALLLSQKYSSKIYTLF